MKRRLAGRLVQNQQPTLLIALVAPAHQEIVESLTKVFERKFDRVLMGERLLVNGTGKQASRVVAGGYHLQHAFQHAAGFIDRQILPGICAPGEDRGSVKLDVFRILIVGSSELVKLATEPVGVRFVHTDASENRVLLTGVSRRSRVVQIQQLHKKSSRVNFRPTDRNAALSTDLDDAGSPGNAAEEYFVLGGV